MRKIPPLISREEIASGKLEEFSKLKLQAATIIEMLNDWLLKPSEHADKLTVVDGGQGIVHLYFKINEMDCTPYDLWKAADERVRRLVGAAIERGGWIGGSDEGDGHVILRYR